jgi:hypothetical protein
VVDELIEELIRTGRSITDAELRELRQSVADSGFDPTATMKASVDIAGFLWQGRTVASNDWLPNDVRHYLRHVAARVEWPVNTTPDEYVRSLADAILDQHGGVCIDKLEDTWQLTFFSKADRWRGPGSGGWILVGYNQGYGYWTTGFQPVDGLDYRPSRWQRMERQWLRHPS